MSPLARITHPLSVIVSTAALALGLLSPAAFAQNPQVEFKTSMGSFTLELYPDKAPKTVANFLQYVKEGFYKDTIFHRVMDGFMIQGGGFERSMREKTTRSPVDNEAGTSSQAGLKNDIGTIAMARTNAPHSATAQFFINTVNNNALNYRESTPSGYGYAVFGRVTRGMDTVMRITKVATGNAGPHQNVPVTPIIIESASLVAATTAPAAEKNQATKK